MRLIDADELKKAIDELFESGGYDSGLVMNTIDNAPTVEPCYQTNSCLDCQMYDKDNHKCPRFCTVIKELVDEERPTGEWKLDDTEQFCYCSNCEDTYYPRPLDPSWNYCPHCGADMKEGG